jgi:adenylate kinase
MAIYLVLIGLPGAGKGTQAGILSKDKGLVHISTGDLFRENIKRQTELGKRVAPILASGALVPDDLTIAMLRERLQQDDSKQGAILDGFPRTTAQADALGGLLNELGGRLNLVPYIKVREDVLIDRLSGRWTCKTCGTVYHEKFNPPKVAGVCDKDGGELVQRPDDKSEAVAIRINEYMNKTMPLIEYFRERGLLVEIDGEQAIEKVTADLLAAVSAVKAS